MEIGLRTYSCHWVPLRTVQLYTRDGIFLTQIAQRDSWVWSVKPRPKNNFVAIGCDDGTLATYQLIFSTGAGSPGCEAQVCGTKHREW